MKKTILLILCLLLLTCTSVLATTIDFSSSDLSSYSGITFENFVLKSGYIESEDITSTINFNPNVYFTSLEYQYNADSKFDYYVNTYDGGIYKSKDTYLTGTGSYITLSASDLGIDSTLISSISFVYDYLSDKGNGELNPGRTIRIDNLAYNTSPVPIPGAAVFMLSGLLGMVGINRRKFY